jgi:hypothetical protein
MALKIAKRPTFRHKVTARVPVDGGHRDEVFTVHYQLASIPSEQLTAEYNADDFLRDIVLSMEDLVDEDGKALPWSDEVREAVLQLPWAKVAIVQGYYAAVNGARAKN